MKKTLIKTLKYTFYLVIALIIIGFVEAITLQTKFTPISLNIMHIITEVFSFNGYATLEFAMLSLIFLPLFSVLLILIISFFEKHFKLSIVSFILLIVLLLNLFNVF